MPSFTVESRWTDHLSQGGQQGEDDDASGVGAKPGRHARPVECGGEGSPRCGDWHTRSEALQARDRAVYDELMYGETKDGRSTIAAASAKENREIFAIYGKGRDAPVLFEGERSQEVVEWKAPGMKARDVLYVGHTHFEVDDAGSEYLSSVDVRSKTDLYMLTPRGSLDSSYRNPRDLELSMTYRQCHREGKHTGCAQ